MPRHLPAMKVASFLFVALLGSQNSAKAYEAGVWQARYKVYVSSLPLGQIDINGSIDEQDYKVDGNAKLIGLIGAAFKISGGAKVEGKFDSPHSTQANAGYKFHYKSPRTHDSISLKTQNGSVAHLSARKMADPLGTRIPVTQKHKQNIADPITAFILPAKNSDGHISKEDCNHIVPIFDGRERFDLKLSYKRMDKTGGRFYKGYTGPVVVCSADYRPISGHRSDDELAAFSAKSKNMEIWLAPVVGTRRLFPFKFLLPTPFGKAEVAADRFHSNAKEIKQSKLSE